MHSSMGLLNQDVVKINLHEIQRNMLQRPCKCLTGHNGYLSKESLYICKESLESWFIQCLFEEKWGDFYNYVLSNTYECIELSWGQSSKNIKYDCYTCLEPFKSWYANEWLDISNSRFLWFNLIPSQGVSNTYVSVITWLELFFEGVTWIGLRASWESRSCKCKHLPKTFFLNLSDLFFLLFNTESKDCTWFTSDGDCEGRYLL